MMAKTRARVIADGTIVKKAEEERVVQQKGLDGVRKALEEAEEQLRGGLDRNLDKVRESYDQNISQIEESIKVQQAMIDTKAKKLRTLKLEDPIFKGDEFKSIREGLKTLNRRKEDLLQNIALAESTEKLLSDRLYFEQNRVSRQARSQNTEIGIKVKADIEQLSKNVEALRQRKLAFLGIQPSEEPNTPVENAILQAQITTLNNSQQQLVSEREKIKAMKMKMAELESTSSETKKKLEQIGKDLDTHYEERIVAMNRYIMELTDK